MCKSDCLDLNFSGLVCKCSLLQQGNLLNCRNTDCIFLCIIAFYRLFQSRQTEEKV